MRYISFHFAGLFYLMLTTIQGFASNEQSLDKMLEEGEVNFLLLDMSAAPSSIVGGVVNVITGNYIESTCDLRLSGANSLSLQRTYNSKFAFRGSLCHGWDLNLPSTASKSGTNCMTVHDRGAELVFSEASDNFCGSSNKDIVSVCIGKKYLSKGVTNCSSGILSSQTNIKNREFHFTKSGNHCELHAESGEILFYSRLKEFPDSYVIAKNQLPTGCLYRYNYDKKERLERVTSMGTKNNPLNYLEWIYPHKFKHDSILTIKASDGREVRYEYVERGSNGIGCEDRFCLSSVSSKHAPDVLYHYPELSKTAPDHVIKKEFPDNRYLKIKYYEQGKNRVGSNYLHIPHSMDSRVGRVSSLYAPAGEDNSSVMIWSFRYMLNRRLYYNVDPYAGITEVVDGLGHRKEYEFSDEQRLTLVRHYLDDDQLYRKERMIWEDKGEKKICLLAQGLSDNNDYLVIRRDYDYDRRGNVLKETLRGNLTGFQSKPIDWDSYKEAEKYSLIYTYTDTGLLKTEDDGRKKTSYQYLKDTNLLNLKLISTKEGICERYYKEYDSNRVLIKEIFDDGDSLDIDNLSGVTERLIKKITPTVSQPIGLAEVVEDYCLDLSTHEEKLISRLENTYSLEGNLLCQKTYGSDGVYYFSKQWKYDFHGNVRIETDALGQVTQYRYDKNDNCIFRQTPNLEVHTIYTYDCMNRQIGQKDIYTNGLVLSTLNSYDCMGNRISSTDKFGNTTSYRYDEFGRLIEKIYPPVLDIYGELINRVDKAAYDSMNHCSEKTDTNGHTTKMRYTARGQLYEMVLADGSVERNIYHLDGKLEKIIHTDGVSTLYTHDYKGRKTSEEKLSPNGDQLSYRQWIYNANHLMAEIDPAGVKTVYDYDPSGKLLSVTKGCSETKYHYDSLGRKVKTWEKYAPNKYRVSICEYDNLNRVVTEVLSDESNANFTKKSYVYDVDGNRSEVVVHNSTEKLSTKSAFNPERNPIQITQPDGAESHYIYHYDSVQIVETVDANGIRSIKTMDSCGRLAIEEKEDALGKLLQRTRYVHDGEGNLLQRSDDVIIDGEVQKSISIVYKYDARNLLIMLIEAAGEPIEKITHKEYNLRGELVRIIKPDGVVLSHAYDFLGRMINLRSSDESINYFYVYDQNNNIVEVYDAVQNLTTHRVFDADNRMISEKLGTGLELLFRYDDLGRIVRITLPDMSSIDYTYNAAYLKAVDRNNFHFDYDYYLSGKLATVGLPNDLGCIGYSYDCCLRPIRAESKEWLQVVPDGGYDRCGNLIKVHQKDSVGDFTSTYSYDSLYHLIGESGIAEHTYSFDSMHNRLKKDEILHSVNSLNQLTQQGSKTYAYDPNGNQSQKSSGGSQLKFIYDAMDRLIGVIDGENKTEYVYDSFHRRIKKSTFTLQNEQWELAETNSYLYLSDIEIGSVDEQGKLVEMRTLGIGCKSDIGAALLMEIGDKTYVPTHDFRGNVVVMLNASNGQLSECYRYSAYGEEQIFDNLGNRSENAICPWRFSSKRVDPETHFSFFGRRYYDCEIGKWTTTDPLGFNDGPNLYAYVHNRPMKYIDPDGKMSVMIATNMDSYIHKEHEAQRRNSGMVSGPGRSVAQRFGDNYEQFANCVLYGYELTCGSEEMPYFEYSNKFKVGNPVNDGLGIGFVNGIRNNRQDAYKSAQIVSNLAGGREVRSVYNPSYGLFLDIFECCLGLAGIETRPSKLLKETWQEFLAEGGTHFLQCAHSQGAIHCRNAAQGADGDTTRHVDFLGVAPAAHMPRGLFADAIHLESQRDIVPGIGAILGGANNSAPRVSLEAHPSADVWDHSFNSETYTSRMAETIDRFLGNNGAN